MNTPNKATPQENVPTQHTLLELKPKRNIKPLNTKPNHSPLIINNFSKPTFIAIDFETSAHTKNSACAIGMVKIKNNTIVDSFYSLIKPPNPQILFTEIHGLTWDMLKSAPTFSQIWNKIYAFIKNTQGFIAHNAAFDRRIYYGTSKSYHIKPKFVPFYCTLDAARKQFELPKNNLRSVCDALHIELDHHNALSDANAAGEIFIKCVNKGYDWNLSKLK